MKLPGPLVLLMLLALAIAGCSFGGGAPPIQKTVGVLLSGDARLAKLTGLKQGLEDLGYFENKNIRYIIKSAGDDQTLIRPLAEELARERPDVLVATGHVEAQALKQVTAADKMPVVFAGVASSVEQGLVESLQRPGSNLTGVDNYHAELSGKRLELLQKLLPGVRRVLVIYDPSVPPAFPGLRMVESAALHLGIRLDRVPVTSREELQRLTSRLDSYAADAVLLMPSFRLEALVGEIVAVTKSRGVPVMGVNEHETELGCLAAYGVSFTNQGRQAARLVDKILNGQKPEHIPVETPENIALVVNLDAARELGLSLSPVGLSFARVITDGQTGKGGAAGE